MDTRWIADLVSDLVDAGHTGDLLNLQLRGSRVIATISFFCTPEAYSKNISKKPIQYGQIRTHINKGNPHTYQVFYSLTEDEYRERGIL